MLPTQGTTEGNTTVATVRKKQEYLLGPIHIIDLGERACSNGTARTEYMHNVIDGWYRSREFTHDTDPDKGGFRTTRSNVGAVLDDATDQAGFIATLHLRWCTILDNAGQKRRATAQRRALDTALARHGLALARES